MYCMHIQVYRYSRYSTLMNSKFGPNWRINWNNFFQLFGINLEFQFDLELIDLEFGIPNSYQFVRFPAKTAYKEMSISP